MIWAGWSRLSARVDRFEGTSAVRRWVTVFSIALVGFFLTANYGPDAFIDSVVAFHPAWHLVNHGHPWLEDGGLRSHMVVPGLDGHLVSNRPPGLIALLIPFYTLFGAGTQDPSPAPAAVAASVAVAVAVASLRVILDEILPSRVARAASLLAAFGTSLWSVAAAEYVSHGPVVMWLSLALLLMVKNRSFWLAGACLGLAVTTRPHIAVVALVLGLAAGWTRRSLAPVLAIGLPSGLGLFAVMLYNRWVFERLNVQGGYADYVAEPLSWEFLTETQNHVTNVVGILVSGSRGVLVLSPFLVLLAPGLRAAWRASPWWAKASATAGLAYMIVQLRIQNGPEGFLGGLLIYAYRYPIEWLFLSAPILALAWCQFVAPGPRRAFWFRALAVVSIWIHAVGAVLYDLTDSMPYDLWLGWSPLMVLFAKSPLVAVASLLVLACALVVAKASHEGAQPGSTSKRHEPGYRVPDGRS